MDFFFVRLIARESALKYVKFRESTNRNYRSPWIAFTKFLAANVTRVVDR